MTTIRPPSLLFFFVIPIFTMFGQQTVRSFVGGYFRRGAGLPCQGWTKIGQASLTLYMAHPDEAGPNHH
jgi:hypothetical protein